MIFRTEINPAKPDFSITYQDHIMLIGSCFVENMGYKLMDLKFNTYLNPTGIVFNPLSICHTLNLICGKKEFTESDLFYHNETWNSFSHHSRFSNSNLGECLKNINSELETSHAFLKQTDFLFITLGTAWVFEKSGTGEVVSNCHKLPPGHFKRRILEVDEIVHQFNSAFEIISSLNKKIKIIFTLSPIRHLKDGLENNSLSKSILRIAIDKIKESKKAEYFPAYEILLDDLRDYRFYASDLCHPSEQATEYIWEKFSDVYFNADTKVILKQIDQLTHALRHKAFHPQSKAYKLFIKDKISMIEDMQSRLPYLRLAEMKEELVSRLSEL